MRNGYIKLGLATAALGVAVWIGGINDSARAGPCGAMPQAEVSSAVFVGAVPGQDVLAAVLGDAIVTVDESGRRVRYAHAGLRGGMLRHAAGDPRFGVAYVNDLAGSDRLALLGGSDDRREIEEPGEVSHPAWSPSGALTWVLDQRVLRVRDGGDVGTIPGPEGVHGIFSPVFVSPAEVVVVASEPVVGYEGEDDALNNLWRLDLATGDWSRLTEFAAAGEAWSLIRTPVVMDDGSLRFVRQSGLSSAVTTPVPELWELSAGEARLVRTLPGETFLAGTLGGDLVLNTLDPVTGEWRLVREREAGAESLGCGAVMVDPLTALDPDVGDGKKSAAMGETSSDAGAGSSSDGGSGSSHAGAGTGPALGILVGDFADPEEARAVADRLGMAGAFRVVGHHDAPTAVARGLWAVVRELPRDMDATKALTAFRGRFPDLADRSWIATL